MVTKQKIILISGAFLFLGIGAIGLVADAPAQDVDVRTFVTRHYYHGIPYEQAHSYGSEAVPELAAMLEDESLEKYWEGIIGTIAYIGDPVAIDPLLEFLDRQQGEISQHAFRAVLSVPQALGHLAQNGAEKPLEILTSFAREEYASRTGLDFSFGRYRGKALSEVMGRMGILGLGVSGRPEALRVLREMDQAAKAGISHSAWKDNVSEAIDINIKIQNEGVAKVFGGKEQ